MLLISSEKVNLKIVKVNLKVRDVINWLNKNLPILSILFSGDSTKQPRHSKNS